jgi:Tfp pilus assembly protein FimT
MTTLRKLRNEYRRLTAARRWGRAKAIRRRIAQGEIVIGDSSAQKGQKEIWFYHEQNRSKHFETCAERN